MRVPSPKAPFPIFIFKLSKSLRLILYPFEDQASFSLNFGLFFIGPGSNKDEESIFVYL